MPTLFLEWGEDFSLTPGGSLQIASGWDEVRQRIERFLLTNPLFTAQDGTVVPPDYIFDINYGLGAGRRVGDNVTQETINAIRQVVNQAVMSDPDVSSAYPPTISIYQPGPHTLVLVINVTLATGQVGKIAISFPT